MTRDLKKKAVRIGSRITLCKTKVPSLTDDSFFLLRDNGQNMSVALPLPTAASNLMALENLETQ